MSETEIAESRRLLAIVVVGVAIGAALSQLALGISRYLLVPAVGAVFGAADVEGLEVGFGDAQLGYGAVAVLVTSFGLLILLAVVVCGLVRRRQKA